MHRMWLGGEERVWEGVWESVSTCLSTPPLPPTHLPTHTNIHLDRFAGNDEAKLKQQAPDPLPLHVILSTPTGSGKTFTAVMMMLHLLRPKQADKEAFPDVVLLYSVPTKQVRETCVVVWE